jgi:hypothetical protein
MHEMCILVLILLLTTESKLQPSRPWNTISLVGDIPEDIQATLIRDAAALSKARKAHRVSKALAQQLSRPKQR